MKYITPFIIDNIQASSFQISSLSSYGVKLWYCLCIWIAKCVFSSLYYIVIVENRAGCVYRKYSQLVFKNGINGNVVRFSILSVLENYFPTAYSRTRNL